MAIEVIYNIDELMQELSPKGITKTGLYRLIRSNKLKSIRIGKRIFVSQTSLNHFLLGENEQIKNN